MPVSISATLGVRFAALRWSLTLPILCLKETRKAQGESSRLRVSRSRFYQTLPVGLLSMFPQEDAVIQKF